MSQEKSLIIRALVRTRPEEQAFLAPIHRIDGEWTLHDVVDAIRERYQVQQVLSFTFFDPMKFGWAPCLFEPQPDPRAVAVKRENALLRVTPDPFAAS